MENTEIEEKAGLSQNAIKQVVAMDTMQIVAFRITALVFFVTAAILWGSVSNFEGRHIISFGVVIGFGMYCFIVASELKDKVIKNLLKIK